MVLNKKGKSTNQRYFLALKQLKSTYFAGLDQIFNYFSKDINIEREMKSFELTVHVCPEWASP